MSKDKQPTRLLQIGSQDWSKDYQVSETVEWIYLPTEQLGYFLKDHEEQVAAYQAEQKRLAKLAEDGEKVLPKPTVKPPKRYAGLLLTDSYYPKGLEDLASLFDAYAVFYNRLMPPMGVGVGKFLKQKMAQSLDFSKPQELVDKLCQSLFDGQYGAKFHVTQLQITPNFQGQVTTEGYSHLVLDGAYGEEFQQIAYFSYNLPHYAPLAQKLFFEHLCSAGVETKIVVHLIASGSLSEVAKEWVFEGNQTKEQLLITAPMDGYLSISLFAKGEGELKLGPCHYRYARHDLGEFILGGERLVDDQQQELMYYFNPQDFKPPLCVYFSGFRTAEGFEGYWMMKAMGTPFMLICDPRLDGGSFYIGSEQLEQAVVDIIQEKLDFLGFDNSQLILSGLSMGTFGAAYHGAKLAPHAIVIGKPVFSLGEVALKEKIHRPAGFPTSLDLLRRYVGKMDAAGAQELDERFWKQFNQGDFSKTTFAIAYMKDDDYDSSAFAKVLDSTRSGSANVLGRGWAGRHGDGGNGPTDWFLRQYYHILKEDFGRN